MNMQTIFLATAFGFAATPTMAYCTSQTFGNQTFTHCSDGSHFNAMQFGNQTFTNGQDSIGRRTNGTSMQFGNQRFYNGPMYDNNR